MKRGRENWGLELWCQGKNFNASDGALLAFGVCYHEIIVLTINLYMVAQ